MSVKSYMKDFVLPNIEALINITIRLRLLIFKEFIIAQKIIKLIIYVQIYRIKLQGVGKKVRRFGEQKELLFHSYPYFPFSP